MLQRDKYNTGGWVTVMSNILRKYIERPSLYLEDKLFTTRRWEGEDIPGMEENE